jgi:hypothetical protein
LLGSHDCFVAEAIASFGCPPMSKAVVSDGIGGVLLDAHAV